MALKFAIKKSEYDKLSDDMKAEYMAGENDGEYVLDVTGLPKGEDVEPIKRALQNERDAHKATKKELGTTKAALEAMPDVETLKADHAKDIKKYKDFTENTLVEGKALELAAKIGKSPTVLLPHIKSRLIADLSGDTPVTKVLDKDGKPSDLTLEKLGEEFVANKDFADIIKASGASGGGMPPRTPFNPNGGGMPPKDNNQAFDASKAKPSDLAAHLKAKKAAQQQ